MELEKHDVPLPQQLADELVGFWEAAFGTAYNSFLPVLRGDEIAENADTIYVYRHAGSVIATCHLTTSKALPEIAGLGEVATAAAFRRRGAARELCRAARNDFSKSGGRALFLGTANPAAVSLYERCGWRRIPGSCVMANTTGEQSLDAFLDAYFRASGRPTVSSGSAADRIPMIPLLVFPHAWCVLDANVGMFSTRYATQPSCMGLYPRYETTARNGARAWFVARTPRGKTVGMATAFLEASGCARIDAFTHRNFTDAWEALVRAAMRWSRTRGATRYATSVCEDDGEKLASYIAVGFRKTGAGGCFDLGERQVPSVVLESKERRSCKPKAYYRTPASTGNAS